MQHTYIIYFAECEVLEKWWYNTTTEWTRNNRNITVVCPYPGLVLNNPILSDTKSRFDEMHTITIDLNQIHRKPKEEKEKTKKILIARIRTGYSGSLFFYYKILYYGFFNIRY